MMFILLSIVTILWLVTVWRVDDECTSDQVTRWCFGGLIICQTRWWDHSGTWWDTQWHFVWHTVAHSGHAVAHSVTYTLTWHSVTWITRARVAPQWNVRKCDTTVVTQAFSPSPSVLPVQQQTTPFFNHFPPNILILAIPNFDDGDEACDPPWSHPSSPYSAPDPATPSLSLGRNQIHRIDACFWRNLMWSSCSKGSLGYMPSYNRGFLQKNIRRNQATQLDGGWLDKLSHFWLAPLPPSPAGSDSSAECRNGKFCEEI